MMGVTASRQPAVSRSTTDTPTAILHPHGRPVSHRSAALRKLPETVGTDVSQALCEPVGPPAG